MSDPRAKKKWKRIQKQYQDDQFALANKIMQERLAREQQALKQQQELQESTLLAVTCPPNVSPGQMIQIRISSQQQLIQARVPPNVKAGQIFHVRVMGL